MDTSNKEKKQFIRETVTRPEKQKLRLGRRLFLTVALALVFGVTSSLTFVVTRPWWEERFETEESSESIVISRDETTTAPSETSTEEETTEEEVTTSPEEWESQVQFMIDTDLADMEDYHSILNAHSSMIASVTRSLVTVTAQYTDMDWFDNPVSGSQSTSGVIIAVTKKEVIILTDSYVLDASEQVQVHFGPSVTAEAHLKQKDGANGIAVVAVSVENLDENVLSMITPVSLGNSLTIAQGQPIIAIGRPLGFERSVAYGIISYTNPAVQSVDSMIRILQTDIPVSKGARGMLVNTSGELVGWLTDNYTSSSTDEFLTAISLSDLKPVIEKMSNGHAMASLGIYGQTVTAEISEKQGIPVGVYVTRSISGGPAYSAGIQDGDILVGINDTAIASMKDLQGFLEESWPGDVVIVQVKRSGQDEYAEFNFEVILEER